MLHYGGYLEGKKQKVVENMFSAHQIELTPRKESMMPSPKRDGTAKRITIDNFFRELTAPECTLTPQQIRDFLETFSATSAPESFVKKMIARFIKSQERQDKNAQGVICGVLRLLIKENFTSLNMKALINVHLFITALIADKTLADLFHSMMLEKVSKAPGTPVTAKPATSQSYFGSVSSIEIAQKLSFIEQKQFKALKIKQLLTDSSNANPQVKALKDRFNNNTTWILSTILSADDDSRPVVIMKFIAVAEYLRQFHNFQVLNAFVSALNDSRVARLKKTWASVNERSMKTFQELNELMSIDGIYAAYKKELQKAPPECIPYMGLYLRDLTYIRENSPKDSIDFEQQKKVRAIADRLSYFQRGEYNFGKKISQINIIGAVHLLSEEELYELSYKIEPRTQPKYALPKPSEPSSESNSCTNSPVTTKKRSINDENSSPNIRSLSDIYDVFSPKLPNAKHKRVSESTPSSRNGSRSNSPTNSNSSLRSLSMSMTISPSSSFGRAIGRQVASLRRTLSDKKLADHFSPIKKDDKKASAKKLSTTKFDLSSKAKITLSKTLGRGGSASAVYLGTLGKRPTPVAIKRFDLKIFGDDEEVMHCIYKELKLASVFHGMPHNNIVEFIGQRTVEKESVDLIMECYQDNLKSFIQRKRQEGTFMEAHQIIEFSLQLASAINYLHSLKQPVIHLDIKPDNIFLDNKDGVFTLKLGDFGEAQTLKKADMLLFTPNVGTTEYRAPEVFGKGCDDNQGYSLKADIWSFGMVLYELMTLSVPYQMDDYTFFQLPSVIEAGTRPTLPDEVWSFVNSGPDSKLWTSLINIFSDTTHKVPACRPTASYLVRKLGALCQ